MAGLHMKAIYSRTGGSAAEDVAVTTHDLWEPGDGSTWTSGDMDIAAGTFLTFFTAIKAVIPNNTTLREVRCYNGYNGDGTPGEVDYIKTANIQGTGGGGIAPPQLAISVTERTDNRLHWGRFYLPANDLQNIDGLDGRIVDAKLTTIANAAETMYESWKGMGADIWPIVWGVVKPNVQYNAAAAPFWGPSWLTPAPPVTVLSTAAWTVQEIQVDDLWDIIRRRRWDNPTARVRRPLGT